MRVFDARQGNRRHERIEGQESLNFLSEGAWVSVPTTKGPLRLGDAARADAARAHPHTFTGFADNYVNVLKIRIPAAFRQIMGMTDAVPIDRTFIANLTASHEGNSPSRNEPEV
jgi:hypothetical protein